MIRILLTSCSAGLKKYEALFFKQQSKFKSQIEVYGCDNNPKKNNLYKKLFKVPMGDDPSYIDIIVDIIKIEKINFIIPSSDEEALCLSKNRAYLKKINCIPLCSDYESLLIVNDKIKTYNLCKKNNIPIAEFEVCKNKKEILFQIEKFNDKYKSFVLKPIDNRGGRGVFIISEEFVKKKLIGREMHLNINHLKFNFENYFRQDSSYIISEKLENCHDVDILCDNGDLVELIFRRRLKTTLPNDGHEIIHDQSIMENVKKICSIFKLNYLHDIDFMLDNNGNFKLIEINPRLSGSAIISSYLGYKIFDNLIALAKNQYNFEFVTKLGKVFPEDLEKFYN